MAGKFKKGRVVVFRVPGLERVEGKSHGVVEGRIVSHDDVEHRVVVTCPLGDEYILRVEQVRGRDGEDLRA